jgi:hypothetical protein
MFKHRLAREVGLLLALKLLLLSGLYFAFFSPAHRVQAGDAQVAARLLSAAAPVSVQQH